MIQVYFNLHKKSWSIRDSVTHRVVNKLEHPTYLVVLRDVTFKVNETGRQRVIREKRKNVHAFACGTQVGFFSYQDFMIGMQPNISNVAAFLKSATVPVSYNPYKAGYFVRTDTGEAIHACKLLVMTTKTVEIFDGKRPKLRRLPVVKALI